MAPIERPIYDTAVFTFSLRNVEGIDDEPPIFASGDPARENAEVLAMLMNVAHVPLRHRADVGHRRVSRISGRARFDDAIPATCLQFAHDSGSPPLFVHDLFGFPGELG